MPDQIIFLSVSISILLTGIQLRIRLGYTTPYKHPQVIIYTYLAGALYNIFLSFILCRIFIGQFNLTYIGIAALSLVLYFSAGNVFFVFPFGIAVTSVRTHILGIVAAAADSGIRYRDILAKYNVRIIAGNRLKRLVALGDIVKTGSQYKITSKVSIVSGSNIIFVALKKIYSRHDQKSL